jgi:hypothetical protein
MLRMLVLPRKKVNVPRRAAAAWIMAAAVASVLAAPALAEERHDDRGRHDEHGRAVHYDHRYSFEAWHGGRWFHGDHGGRAGWWWVVGGIWYFYPAPVYPYPAPPATVYVGPVAPVPAAQYYYWCGRPAGYYPYVQGCHVPWQPVPVAVAPAPAPVPVAPPATPYYAPPPGAAATPGPPPGYAAPPGAPPG